MNRVVYGFLTASVATAIVSSTVAYADTNTTTPKAVNQVPLDVLQSYTVAAGDTLWNFASVDGVPVSAVSTANPGLDANNLQIGQTVVVPRTWVVHQGDSLFEISRTYGVSVASLERLNNVTHPLSLKIGTPILIPAKTSATAAPKYATWKVKPGDTLWKIGQATGSSWSQLAALNAIGNPDILDTGRMLLIPTNPQSWTVTPPSSSQSPAPSPATPTGQTSQGSVPPATSVAKIDVTLATTPPVVKTSANPMYNSWTYTIEVTQRDAQGSPVPNETLEVYGNPGANVNQVTTDSEGHASFTITMTQQDILSSPGGQTGIWVKDDATNVVGSTIFALPKVTGN